MIKSNEIKSKFNGEEKIFKSIDVINEIFLKGYLSHLEKQEILEFKRELSECQPIFVKINKIVYDKDVFCIDKLTSLYSTLYTAVDQIITLIKGSKDTIDFYIGIRMSKNEGSQGKDLLRSTLNGFFPGVQYRAVFNDSENLQKIRDVIKKSLHLSTVSGIASLRSEKREQKSFIQGVEKLVDGALGKEYIAMFIADKITTEQLIQRRETYENFYSVISPLVEINRSYSESNTGSVSQSISRKLEDLTDNELENKVTSAKGNIIKKIKSARDWIIPINVSTSKTDTNTFQFKYENRHNKEISNRLNEQLKRLNTSENFGMWDFSAYFMGSDIATTRMLASLYNGIIRGKDSYLESSAINVFKNINTDLISYIENFRHPVFKIVTEFKDAYETPAVAVNSEELSIHMCFPQISIPGLIVKEHASFGREVIKEFESEVPSDIELGKIYHLGKKEDAVVSLDVDSLTKHTLITGSTGSGKSNTTYKILQSLDSSIPFLVIEPAKGEYKEIFRNIKVYGSNPCKTEILKLNPFCFPKEVHILSHIDMLLEVFNVCWPMYAAMPAILKESIERAYEACGWNLIRSEALFQNLFPTFEDVLFELKHLMDNTEYSSETKGDYKGALEMRLKSLTNGINGLMLNGEDTDLPSLLDQRVIIDLSEVGSSETKSMIMGILILKLSEYRSTTGKMNSSLKHITVLEEAHNLLKRTSTEQSSDSSNLIGKSVEMLANSIAEMRTYGEGFLIVDQSPSMLDLSAIRNTNTKIIMSLPDFNDREVVGKAAGLTEIQIQELSNLKTGVAAVYQNNWAEAVLCQVDKIETPSEKLNFTNQNFVDLYANNLKLYKRLYEVYKDENHLMSYLELKKLLYPASISSSVKYLILKEYSTELLNTEELDIEDLSIGKDCAAEIFATIIGINIAEECENCEDMDTYNKLMVKRISDSLENEIVELFDTKEKLLDMYIYGCYCKNIIDYDSWKFYN